MDACITATESAFRRGSLGSEHTAACRGNLHPVAFRFYCSVDNKKGVINGEGGGSRTHSVLYSFARQVLCLAIEPSKDAAFIAFPLTLQKEHLGHDCQRVSTKTSTKMGCSTSNYMICLLASAEALLPITPVVSTGRCNTI